MDSNLVAAVRRSILKHNPNITTQEIEVIANDPKVVAIGYFITELNELLALKQWDTINVDDDDDDSESDSYNCYNTDESCLDTIERNETGDDNTVTDTTTDQNSGVFGSSSLGNKRKFCIDTNYDKYYESSNTTCIQDSSNLDNVSGNPRSDIYKRKQSMLTESNMLTSSKSNIRKRRNMSRDDDDIKLFKTKLTNMEYYLKDYLFTLGIIFKLWENDRVRFIEEKIGNDVYVVIEENNRANEEMRIGQNDFVENNTDKEGLNISSRYLSRNSSNILLKLNSEGDGCLVSKNKSIFDSGKNNDRLRGSTSLSNAGNQGGNGTNNDITKRLQCYKNYITQFIKYQQDDYFKFVINSIKTLIKETAVSNIIPYLFRMMMGYNFITNRNVLLFDKMFVECITTPNNKNNLQNMIQEINDMTVYNANVFGIDEYFDNSISNDITSPVERRSTKITERTFLTETGPLNIIVPEVLVYILEILTSLSTENIIIILKMINNLLIENTFNCLLFANTSQSFKHLMGLFGTISWRLIYDEFKNSFAINNDNTSIIYSSAFSDMEHSTNQNLTDPISSFSHIDSTGGLECDFYQNKIGFFDNIGNRQSGSCVNLDMRGRLGWIENKNNCFDGKNTSNFFYDNKYNMGLEENMELFAYYNEYENTDSHYSSNYEKGNSSQVNNGDYGLEGENQHENRENIKVISTVTKSEQNKKKCDSGDKDSTDDQKQNNSGSSTDEEKYYAFLNGTSEMIEGDLRRNVNIAEFNGFPSSNIDLKLIYIIIEIISNVIHRLMFLEDQSSIITSILDDITSNTPNNFNKFGSSTIISLVLASVFSKLYAFYPSVDKDEKFFGSVRDNSLFRYDSSQFIENLFLLIQYGEKTLVEIPYISELYYKDKLMWNNEDFLLHKERVIQILNSNGLAENVRKQFKVQTVQGLFASYQISMFTSKIREILSSFEYIEDLVQHRNISNLKGRETYVKKYPLGRLYLGYYRPYGTMGEEFTKLYIKISKDLGLDSIEEIKSYKKTKIDIEKNVLYVNTQVFEKANQLTKFIPIDYKGTITSTSLKDGLGFYRFYFGFIVSSLISGLQIHIRSPRKLFQTTQQIFKLFSIKVAEDEDLMFMSKKNDDIKDKVIWDTFGKLSTKKIGYKTKKFKTTIPTFSGGSLPLLLVILKYYSLIKRLCHGNDLIETLFSLDAMKNIRNVRGFKVLCVIKICVCAIRLFVVNYYKTICHCLESIIGKKDQEKSEMLKGIVGENSLVLFVKRLKKKCNDCKSAYPVFKTIKEKLKHYGDEYTEKYTDTMKRYFDYLKNYNNNINKTTKISSSSANELRKEQLKMVKVVQNESMKKDSVILTQLFVSSGNVEILKYFIDEFNKLIHNFNSKRSKRRKDQIDRETNMIKRRIANELSHLCNTKGSWDIGYEYYMKTYLDVEELLHNCPDTEPDKFIRLYREQWREPSSYYRISLLGTEKSILRTHRYRFVLGDRRRKFIPEGGQVHYEAYLKQQLSSGQKLYKIYNGARSRTNNPYYNGDNPIIKMLLRGQFPIVNVIYGINYDFGSTNCETSVEDHDEDVNEGNSVNNYEDNRERDTNIDKKEEVHVDSPKNESILKRCQLNDGSVAIVSDRFSNVTKQFTNYFDADLISLSLASVDYDYANAQGDINFSYTDSTTGNNLCNPSNFDTKMSGSATDHKSDIDAKDYSLQETSGSNLPLQPSVGPSNFFNQLNINSNLGPLVVQSTPDESSFDVKDKDKDKFKGDNKIFMRQPCILVQYLNETRGTATLFRKELVFVCDKYNVTDKKNIPPELVEIKASLGLCSDMVIPVSNIKEVNYLRYKFKNTAVEITLKNGNGFILDFPINSHTNKLPTDEYESMSGNCVNTGIPNNYGGAGSLSAQSDSFGTLGELSIDYSSKGETKVLSRKAFVEKLKSLNNDIIIPPDEDPYKCLQINRYTILWQNHLMSNFDYLMILNRLAGRTFLYFGQYPIFPWVLRDYMGYESKTEPGKYEINLDEPFSNVTASQSEYSKHQKNVKDPEGFLKDSDWDFDKSIYRNFEMPIKAQTSVMRSKASMKYRAAIEIQKQIEEKMKKNGADMKVQKVSKFKKKLKKLGEEYQQSFYKQYVSSSMTPLRYLVRMEPYSIMSIEYNNGYFDQAARIFKNIINEYEKSENTDGTTDELIPEFFYNPEFLLNTNRIEFGAYPVQHKKIDSEGKAVTTESFEKLDDVVLPRWANGSAERFIHINRLALESEYVSANIHKWIDLIFGYKQYGSQAINSLNLYAKEGYEETYNYAVSIGDIQQIKSSLESATNIQIPKRIFEGPHPSRNGVVYSTKASNTNGQNIDDIPSCESGYNNFINNLFFSSNQMSYSIFSRQISQLIQDPRYPNIIGKTELERTINFVKQGNEILPNFNELQSILRTQNFEECETVTPNLERDKSQKCIALCEFFVLTKVSNTLCVALFSVVNDEKHNIFNCSNDSLIGLTVRTNELYANSKCKDIVEKINQPIDREFRNNTTTQTQQIFYNSSTRRGSFFGKNLSEGINHPHSYESSLTKFNSVSLPSDEVISLNRFFMEANSDDFRQVEKERITNGTPEEKSMSCSRSYSTIVSKEGVCGKEIETSEKQMSCSSNTQNNYGKIYNSSTNINSYHDKDVDIRVLNDLRKDFVVFKMSDKFNDGECLLIPERKKNQMITGSKTMKFMSNLITDGFSPLSKAEYCKTGILIRRYFDVRIYKPFPIYRSEFNRNDMFLENIVWCPDIKGRFYCVASPVNNGGMIEIYDVQTNEMMLVFGGFMSSITSISMSRDGRFILATSKDTTARLYKVESSTIKKKKLNSSKFMDSDSKLKQTELAEDEDYDANMNDSVKNNDIVSVSRIETGEQGKRSSLGVSFKLMNIMNYCETPIISGDVSIDKNTIYLLTEKMICFVSLLTFEYIGCINLETILKLKSNRKMLKNSKIYAMPLGNILLVSPRFRKMYLFGSTGSILGTIKYDPSDVYTFTPERGYLIKISQDYYNVLEVYETLTFKNISCNLLGICDTKVLCCAIYDNDNYLMIGTTRGLLCLQLFK